MKPAFVLVHGAWHGGWCWQRVTPLLRATGHEVHAPTLTGLGDRAHLADRKIDLETHIADVVGFLEMEDLADVVLVGHSYAGMVIAGVADCAAKRLKRLVYLDGFVPEHGKCVLDYWSAEARADFEQRCAPTGFIPPTPLPAYGVTRPEDLAWAEPRIRPHPFATWTQPLFLKKGETTLPRAYIRCTDPARPVFDQFSRKVRDDPRWAYREIACGHDSMIAEPERTADLLLSLA
ncbi:MAG TPA: alpha/beta fold hydrolase [Alphaproteobacteria bacterium]